MWKVKKVKKTHPPATIVIMFWQLLQGLMVQYIWFKANRADGTEVSKHLCPTNIKATKWQKPCFNRPKELVKYWQHWSIWKKMWLVQLTYLDLEQWHRHQNRQIMIKNQYARVDLMCGPQHLCPCQGRRGGSRLGTPVYSFLDKLRMRPWAWAIDFNEHKARSSRID